MEMTLTGESCFRLFATLFSYPVTDYKEAITSLAASPGLSPEVSSRVTLFSEAVGGLDLAGLEEAFTYTFDLNPGCCLELGWHLYGETYKRGEFLVKMRQYLRNYNIPESSELPDHLSHCLLVLENFSREDGASFFQTYLFPAMKKIITALPEDNPYHSCILALQAHLTKKYSLNEE